MSVDSPGDPNSAAGGPHIGLNAQLLSLSPSYRSAGINRYIYNVLLGLSHSEGPHRFTVFLSERNFPPVERFRLELSRLPTQKPFARILWEQFVQPLLLSRLRVDLLHSMAFVAPVAHRGPSVVTIYDLSFLRFPGHFRRWNRFYLSTFTKISARKADHLIAISKSTARDITRLLGVSEERVSVVYCGVEPNYRRLPPEQVDEFRRERGLPQRMILYLGTIEPRKNLPRLLEAYRMLVRGWPSADCPHLVIAGAKGWMWQDVFAQVDALGPDARIAFPGYVPAAELPWWYNAAEVFVYPSTYEGFGLPVLEAMACGAPVVSSNSSSLPEVVGDGGLMVRPDDADGLAQAIGCVLKDPGLREDLRERGLRQAGQFSWDKAGRETLAVYDRVLNRGGL